MATADQSFFGWVWFFVNEYWPQLLKGAGVTLMLALVGTLIGCIIGLLVGIVQTIPVSRSTNPVFRVLYKIVRAVLAAYVELFRGTPMIVQAMVIYYGSMAMFQIDMTPMFAGFFIVSINTGAYMAETVRGGIASIDVGQTEGAKSIGMTHFQTMYYVVLPQALRNILPQIGNNLIINIKDTSVLSVISVTELFFTGKSAAGVYYRYFEVFFIICVIYFIMTFASSRILRWMEKKIDGNDYYDLVPTDHLVDPCGHVPIKPRRKF
ncbi:amino acid ABC transporter permease [Hydrogenoanaerobacterium sp.]|uniref:amino acid ABC transporter permease n=1 Tax=Hydrogenoanaerobacterium sp. TaxID=2953763 RepID=UPI00289A499F|nr:amino acid ABC transporter permease [Hydrogenoanaerobacterium sp.]